VAPPAGPALVTDDELAALDDLPGKGGTWAVDGVELSVSNLDKVLFPAVPGGEAGDGRPEVTKRDLLRYLAQVSGAMIPYFAGRPCNMVRHPNGTDANGFWAKAAPKNAPDWMTQWPNEDAAKDETRWYVVVDRPATLLSMGNLAAVEYHPWTSSCARSHEPDWALIDLDPGTETTWEQVVLLAKLHQTALDHLDLRAGLKVTGKRGIQIWIPIEPGIGFDDTLAWVEKLSHMVGQLVPDLVSWAWSKADRSGKARLDYTQNIRNKTLVGPFSPRAASGGPVSVPLHWDELDDPDLAPDRWTVHTLPARLAETGDPMADLIGLPQQLPAI
jgi:bifunctional non-homologous end joining protein LigD